MSDSASKQSEKKSAEENAAQWPPADYREFVQAQIANKMLLRIGGIGVGTFIALSTAYVGAQQYFNTASQSQLVTTVKEKILNELPVHITKQIIDQTKLVASVRTDLESSLADVSQRVIKSPEFTVPLNARVFEYLTQSEALQSIILTEAWNKAEKGKSDAIRSLGLQLYALFHGGERASTDQKKLRQNFLELAGSNDIPLQLMSTLLKYYPMGEYSDGECKTNIIQCEEFDRQMVGHVLSRLGGPHGHFEKLQEDYTNLLSRIPRSRQVDVLRWMEKDGRSKAMPILAAWARVEDRQFRESAVRIMADLATDTDESLRTAGLRGLAGIDPEADLHRGTRAYILSQLLTAASTLGGESANLRTLGRRATDTELVAPTFESRLPRAIDLPPGFEISSNRSFPGRAPSPQVREQTSLIERTAKNMLRTGMMDRNGASLNDPNRDNDWTGVVLATLKPTPGAHLDSMVLRVWMERVSYDARLGLNVAWAADALLDYAFAKVPDARRAYANAIQHASPKGIQAFAERYLSHWKSNGARETDIVYGAIREWFDKLARTTKDILNSNDQNRAQALKERVSQITYFLNSRFREFRWQMIESIEAANLFAVDKRMSVQEVELLKPMLAHLAWYGLPLDSNVHKLEVFGKGSLELPTDAEGRREASESSRDQHWWNVVIAKGFNVVIECPKDARLIAFDKNRMRIVGRSHSPGQGLTLSGINEAEYAVTLVNFGNQPVKGPIKVLARTGPMIVAPTSRSNPLQLTDSQVLEFRTGTQRGSLWMALELTAGAELNLETRRVTSILDLHPEVRRLFRNYGLTQSQQDRILYARSSLEVPRRVREYAPNMKVPEIESIRQAYRSTAPDTMISIYDAETGAELDSDDDGGSDLFSKLNFTRDRAIRLLIHVAGAGDESFSSGVRFEIDVALVQPRARRIGSEIGPAARQ